MKLGWLAKNQYHSLIVSNIVRAFLLGTALYHKYKLAWWDLKWKNYTTPHPSSPQHQIHSNPIPNQYQSSNNIWIACESPFKKVEKKRKINFPCWCLSISPASIPVQLFMYVYGWEICSMCRSISGSPKQISGIVRVIVSLVWTHQSRYICLSVQ